MTRPPRCSTPAAMTVARTREERVLYSKCMENVRTDQQGPGPAKDALALAKHIVEVAEDKQASDIVILDIRPLSILADYFVICSGTSERQLSAINRDIVEALWRDKHRKPRRTEGRAESGWIVLDYDEVIVHIFAPPEREFYQLEELWSAAVPVVRIQ